MTESAAAFSQHPAGVRFEWGVAGAAATSEPTGAIVIVDVLSFTTAVTIAVERGMAIYPHSWPSADAETFALAHDAVCAVGRRDVDADRPWSLSPAHLLAAPRLERLVLPSPNGSAIAATASAQTVVAGCLRNATAVGQWLSEHDFGRPERPAAIIAAGERWPDGELRPALEDFLGAGAIIAAISDQATRSHEAAVAEAAWRAHSERVDEALRCCSSGRELTDAGYTADVSLASEHDVQDTVPLLRGGAFRRYA